MKAVLFSLAAAALAVSPAMAQGGDGATKGKMLYSTDGKRVAVIYRVDSTGAVQVILEGKLVTVPASTISVQDGKAQTSLTKSQLLASR